MIELVWDVPFSRILKKWKRRHLDLIINFHSRLKLFTENPYHSSLKTHSLSGKLKGYWAFSINYDYRLVFEFITTDKALLIDIGTHDEVY